jgi:hypothetical protein
MKLKITKEFIEICKDILIQNWTEKEWSGHEEDDWFVTNNYEGGFDANENAFCFSYIAPDLEEYWFQIKLNEVMDIVDGKIDKTEARKAE